MATRTDLIALHEILTERSRQDAKWGEQNHPDGTGPDVRVLSAPRRQNLDVRDGDDLAEIFTQATDQKTEQHRVTWRDIFLEEAFESLAEKPDSAGLVTEIVQTAAVGVSWLGAISRRTMPQRRIYIAGPMAGVTNPEEIFVEVAKVITSQGHVAVNPVDVAPMAHPSTGCPDGYVPGTESEHTSSACFMRTDLLALLTCDSIMMLPGWENSRGATVEKSVAEACGMPVDYWVDQSPSSNEFLSSALDEQ